MSPSKTDVGGGAQTISDSLRSSSRSGKAEEGVDLVSLHAHYF